MTPEIERLVLAGERLAPAHALNLLGCEDILRLGALADERRRRLHPSGSVTYLIDRNINYTNVCLSGCRFCAFYRRPGDPRGYVLSREEIGAKIDEAKALGATSILLQGGLHPDLGIEYFESLFSFIRRRHPIHLHALSPPEIVHIADISGLDIAEAIRRLRLAGLGSIPGGGAEILSDGVRGRLSPRKCSAGQWLEVMAEAHRQGLRTSATMMLGSSETLEERLEHLLRLRELQDATGGFTAFIPWTFQSANTELQGQIDGGRPNEGCLDYLRTVAAARLVLDNFEHVQASWVTQGAKVAQVALRCGADDFGSTMIEENVVAAAGVTYRLSEAEIARHIRDAGFTPLRRDVLYNVLGPPLRG